MDYYEPTLLFRQNAIKKPDLASSSVYSSSNNSATTLLAHSNRSSGSWLLNHSNTSDSEIISKACSLNKVNISSNYWKIPDSNMDLTALATSNQYSAHPLLAISSAQAENNLFIYEVDAINNYLTHHTTISLPNIHGLSWVPNSATSPGARSKYLVSGNNKGYAHLVSVPLPKSYGGEQDEESAEIVKRFNHRKHLKSVNKDPSMATHAKTCISNLGFTGKNDLVTIYDDALFVWDMMDCEASMRPRPLRITVTPGLANFDMAPPSTNDPYTLALCGKFGISLFDFRSKGHCVPNSSLHSTGTRAQIASNLVKWCPTNEYVMAAAHHDGVVRLWDLRKQDTFASLNGHRNKKVTTMEWNHNDIFTGANDGSIVHWDLSSDLGANADLADHATKISTCSMKEGVSSVAFDPKKNSTVDCLSERQCGTLLPALNSSIVGMCSVRGSEDDKEDCKIISVDLSSFLGLHSKIYNAVENNQSHLESQKFYSKEDLALISASQKETNETLVGSSESLTKTPPLQIPKKDAGHSRDKSFATANVDFDKESVVSLHSIDSEATPTSPSSASTNDDDADSVYTLSTVATRIDSREQEPCHVKQKLLSFLDGDLEQICRDFANLSYFTTAQ